MAAAPRSAGVPKSRSDLAGRSALVLGLARSGVAAARFLADAGAVVTVYDRRPVAELAPAVATLDRPAVTLALGVEAEQVRALLTAADMVVTSPSVSARFPTTDPWLRELLLAAETEGAVILSEVDLFLRLTDARILAVTGTKGKTTTASLADAILAAGDVPHVLGGNIGVPLVERAHELGPETWAVLELSELQLPTLSRGAEVAVYTNILADHLDRHGTVAAYQTVKGRLAELSSADGHLVLNGDDAGCLALGARLPDARIHWYGLEPRPGLDAWVEDGWVVLGGEPAVPVTDIRLRGAHMLRNVLAAAIAARLAGANADAVRAGASTFAGVPHRLESLGYRGGVEFVNDSQATIPLAAIAGLGAFGEGQVVVISGGQGKGLTYDDFADAVAARARAAILIGETADELERLIGGRIPVTRAASMGEAVAAAAAVARAGDVVLLAPAAASFDMFTDYADRGNAFRRAVEGLAKS